MNSFNWNQHIGSKWASLLHRVELKKNDCVIEIGAGSQPKVALGLKEMQFAGVLFLIDLSIQVFETAKIYSKLLPQAIVIPIQGDFYQLPLSTFEGYHIKFLFGNHIIDDLLLFLGISEIEDTQLKYKCPLSIFSNASSDYYALDNKTMALETAMIWQFVLLPKLGEVLPKCMRRLKLFCQRLHIQSMILHEYSSYFFETWANQFPILEMIYPIVQLSLQILRHFENVQEITWNSFHIFSM
jgi:hypothetical protein